MTIDGAIVSSDDAISFGNINLGQNLSMTSAGGAITIGTISAASGSRDVTITSSGGSANTVAVGAIGGSTNINTVAITGSTSVTLNGNITTDESSSNSLTVTGTTINTGAITIDTDNTNDGAINLVGSVAGSNNNLVLNSGGADITLSGAAFNLGSGSLTTTGDINLANNVSITATGGMTINDKIDADNASSNDRTLTLSSGTGATMTFSDAIGSAQPLAGLTITQSNGVTFNSTLDITDGSPGTLTVTDTENGSDIVFNGAVTLEAVSFAQTGYDLVFNGSGNTFANAATFQNTGTLTLGNNTNDTFVFDAGLTENTTGTVTLAGSIDSTNDDITFGAITLAAATTIDTNASDTTGDIIIGAVTGANNNLTLDTTTSTGSADHTFTGDINLGTGTLDVTGDVVLGANVTVTTTKSSGNGILFRDAVNADSASSNDRTLTLNSGTGSAVFVGGNVGASQALAGLTVTQSTGVSFSGSVDVSDSSSGTITLTDTTDGANITFSGAVTADNFVTAAQGYDIFLMAMPPLLMQ